MFKETQLACINASMQWTRTGSSVADHRPQITLEMRHKYMKGSIPRPRTSSRLWRLWIRSSPGLTLLLFLAAFKAAVAVFEDVLVMLVVFEVVLFTTRLGCLIRDPADILLRTALLSAV